MKNFHMMTKFSNTHCNLCCSHCYLDKVQPYPEYTTCDMDDETFQLFIRLQIAAQETDDVMFSWQSNELTSQWFDFFKRVIKLQQQSAQGKNIINTVLINGILLDDRWCEFFKRNQFIISISANVDTPLRSNFCETISGKPTTQQIEQTVRLLQKHDVEFNTLTVVDAMNSQQPLRTYHYLKSLGSRHMQFIPLLEPLAQGGVDTRSLAPTAWGTFLKTIFYTWIRLDIGTINIPIFEHAFTAWCGLPAASSIFSPSDNNASILEINDDLYQCDRFVNSASLLSNNHQPATAIIQEFKASQIIGQYNPLLAAECTSCKVKFACHGGCPQDRIALSRRGVPELNYFCESYQAFFTYIEPYMLMMRALWEQNYAPSDIRQYLV